MILTRLSLHNYSAFHGLHAIEFGDQGKSGRNITLIGGKNGCGKTSILESLRLCLYGPAALGLRAPDATYWEFLRSRINERARKRSEETRVELDFKYSIDGILHRFHVIRGWMENGEKLVERLSVQKDGIELDELENNQWQSFINGLIPPGISHFFFFDAEQIERLIDERTANVKLRESVYALLNLDLLERLGGDLENVQSRILRRRQDIQPELSELTFQLESVANEDSAALRNIETHEASLKQKEARIREIEQSLFVEGQSLHDVKARLKAEKLQVEEQLRSLRKEQAEIAGNFLPFAILRTLSKGFEQRLDVERNQRQVAASRRIVQGLLPDVCAEVKERLELSGTEAASVSRALAAAWTTAIDRKANAFGMPLHNLSDMQSVQMVRHIRESQTSAHKRLSEISGKTQGAYERMKVLTSRLNRLDTHAVVPETQAEYKALTSSLAKDRAQLHSQIQRHEDLAKTLERLRAKKTILQQDLTGFDADSKKVETASKVSRVIERLFNTLAEKKLLELAEKTTEIYKSLARKRGLVKEIRFSATDMQVELLTKDGAKLNRVGLSAGEKQMLAVSILWALGKVSGRSLPIVIDTPLARLDSDHRDSFVLKYLPRASHQVVVLSTDTEIDRNYSDRLSGHIAKEYLLQFDGGSASSQIKPGYFFGANA
jgi:DNA sulfur modification protein DndD